MTSSHTCSQRHKLFHLGQCVGAVLPGLAARCLRLWAAFAGLYFLTGGLVKAWLNQSFGITEE